MSIKARKRLALTIGFIFMCIGIAVLSTPNEDAWVVIAAGFMVGFGCAYAADAIADLIYDAAEKGPGKHTVTVEIPADDPPPPPPSMRRRSDWWKNL